MKMLLVANAKNKDSESIWINNVSAQVDNSMRVGWDVKNIIIVTNMDLTNMGADVPEPVKMCDVRCSKLNKRCLTGSKMFAISSLLSESQEAIWAHDLDLWQVFPFSEPLFRDVGISTYSRESKYNGGSVFWKPAAIDIAHVITSVLGQAKSEKEEPTINRVFKLDTYKERVTILDTTYNVGCSGFKVRFEAAEKPVKCVHFHPCNRIAWDTHVRDRNHIGSSPVSEELMELLLKWYPCIKEHVYTEDPNGPKGHAGDWQRPEGGKYGWQNT